LSTKYQPRSEPYDTAIEPAFYAAQYAAEFETNGSAFFQAFSAAKHFAHCTAI